MKRYLIAHFINLLTRKKARNISTTTTITKFFKCDFDIIKCMNNKIALGQFYTSRTIADYMISLITKSKQSKIIESGYGMGVFINALLEEGFEDIVGYDIDKNNFDFVSEKYGSNAKIFLKDYLATGKEDKADVIIGNPPYVSWNRIDSGIRRFLTTDKFWKPLTNGEWDLSYAFMVWSVEKLKPHGELIYIVPFNWFNSTFAGTLRDYMLENGEFEIINHFGEFKLFNDCFPNNIIFRYRKQQKEKKKIFVSDFVDRRGNIGEIIGEIKHMIDIQSTLPFSEVVEKQRGSLKFFFINQFNKNSFWYLATNEDEKFAEFIESAVCRVTLRDDFNVAVGIVSGYDKAFKVNEEQYELLTEKEKDYIRNFVKASNCYSYRILGQEKYIFLEDILFEEELENLPHINLQIRAQKKELESRYLSKTKKWWNWATIRNLSIHKNSENIAKIFVPCIDRSKSARFSLTTEKVWPAGDVLSITAKSQDTDATLFALAWLNSSFVNRWYKVKGSKAGHRTKYTQIYVSKIPLLRINFDNLLEQHIYFEIIKIMKSCFNEKSFDEKNVRTTTDYLFKQILNGR